MPDSAGGDGLLPTVQSPGGGAGGGSGGDAQAYQGTPSYRRHTRKRSSMVLIPPRAPPALATDGLGAAGGPAGGAVPPGARAGAVSAGSFLSGAGLLAGAQALAKVLTFVLNQALLRFVDARDLGSSAQMDLLGSTILSLARDAVRSASQRQSLAHRAPDEYRTGGGAVHGTESGTLQETVNLGWVPLGLGVVLVALIGGSIFIFGSPQTRLATLLYGASTLIELAAEPCFLLVQLKLQFKKRAAFESLAMIVRCVVTFAVLAAGRAPLLGYALGQLAYGTVLCIAYYLDAIMTYHYAAFKLYPRAVWHEQSDNTMFWDPDSKQLALGMYLQAGFKYLLTESDRLMISFILPLERQGEYALASNYGSLLARLGLFPVEEALRSVFAKSLVTKEESHKSRDAAAAAAAAAAAVADKASRPTSPLPGEPPKESLLNTAQPEESRGNSPEPGTVPFPSLADGHLRPPQSQLLRSPSQRRERAVSASSAYSGDFQLESPTAIRSEKEPDTQLAVTLLSTVLRAYSYLGLAAAIFGPLVAGYGLSLLVARSWLESDAPRVLAAYFCYIPILAWNGAIEALIQSVASVADLRQQSTVMLALSVVFVLQAYFFMRVLGLGAVGLVYAQGSNMLLRIAWSLRFTVGYFSALGRTPAWLWQCVPAKLVLSVATAVAAVAWSRGAVRSFAGLAVDAVLGAAIALAALVSERRNFKLFLANLRIRT